MSFVRQFGETPARMWVEACDELTDDECRRGLTAARRRGGAFPCNLGEFVEMCGRGTRHGPRYLGVPIDRSASLPPPPANPDHVADCIERMRASVGRAGGDSLEYDEFKLDAPVIKPANLACTCPPDTSGQCAACQEWDRRMREVDAQ